MARAIDKETMLDLIIKAKRTDTETGSFAEWLAEYLVEHAPTLTPPNEPLSIGQLREMDGEPVWLDVADGVWALVDTDDDCVWLDRGGSIDIYKLTGKVYRHPPEGEADGE